MSEKIHDAEEAAARRALEAAELAFRSAQYDPAPYTTGMQRLRKIAPPNSAPTRSNHNGH